MTDEQMLDLAERLVAAAADTILRLRARGVAVEAKRDATPVTEADRAAEALITAGLRAGAPDVPVVAEEAAAEAGFAVPDGPYWLVDPLDGTREFAAGRDEFTVNIGLVRAGRAVLGAVAVPALGEVFGGIVGRGAWKAVGGARRPITVRVPPEQGLTVFASRHYADDPNLAALLAGLKVAHLTNAGSGLKFLRVAEGVADFYPRLGRTYEWDTAAPQAVVEAAGGRVTVTATGEALRYGKPGWENPPFMCRGA